MWLSLRRWRPTHLMGAWITWWTGLTAVSFRDVIWAGLRVSQSSGAINGGLGDQGLGVTVVDKAGVTVATQYPLWTVVAWTVLPPLALWVLWLLARERTPDGASASAPAGLAEGWRDVEPGRGAMANTPVTPVGGVER